MSAILSELTHPSRRAVRRTAAAALLWALAALLCAAGLARAEPEPLGRLGGLRAVIEGEPRELPVLKTDMSARIQGDLATVRLVQVFANPSREPLHARYVFPLPADAAVFAMRLRSGGQMLEADIQRAERARETFERAVQAGQQAALLSQERPNVFVQEVGNLMPGEPVQVELEYAHVVPKSGAGRRFVFPMVVGPRYLGGAGGGEVEADSDPDSYGDSDAVEPLHPSGAALELGRWRLPASAPLARGGELDAERVQIRVELDGGVPVRSLASPSHAIRVTAADARNRAVELSGGRTLDDRDFVLDYSLAGEQVEAGAITHAGEGEGYLSVLLEPPRSAPDAELTPRELVFVLDCSGSMAGIPLEASKRFMRRALPQLRPSDSFRIIEFSDSADEWSAAPLPATAQNIALGLQYIEQLQGMGGTEMSSGIRTALAGTPPAGALRLVVFLTDGYIGQDVEIVRLIQRLRGSARLFAFGIGNSVNRYLIEEMARSGRGAARVVLVRDDSTEAEQAADELAARLAAPLLTDLEVDWRGAPVADASPRPLPDLFLGQSVRIMARYTAPGRYRVALRGTLAGRRVELPLELDLPARPDAEKHGALPILWARAQIEDRMTTFIDPARGEAERDALQEQVTQLGLTHRLVTRWTSFVAVAKPIVNPGGRGDSQDVAVPQADGVSELAYPEGAGGSPTSSRGAPLQSPQAMLVASADPAGEFGGSAAPEPGTWAALFAMLAATVLYGRRRQRAQ